MSLSFSALEIGHGDAFLLEKDDWRCLFDSGASKSSIVSLLKKKKINIRKRYTAVEAIYMSHNSFHEMREHFMEYTMWKYNFKLKGGKCI